ncbi:MAG TPA: hypothetical protein VGR19_04610 [Allosphingosinicella sp.]|nr:hypothetical protein [Allosphingosinicella sp.]
MASIAGVEPKIETGRVVQRGFDTLGQHFLPYLGLGLLLSGLPSALMQWFVLSGTIDPANTTLGYSFTPLFILGWVISAVGAYILQATVVRSSIMHLGGRQPEIGGSLAIAFRFLIPLIVISILTWVLTTIGLIFLIVPGVIIFIMLIVSVPALIEERGGIFHSMRRSRELTKGSRGRIFLLLLLFGVIYLILAGIASAIVEIAVDSIVIKVLFQGLVGTVTSVLVAAMLASLYFELRTVKEGATVEGLAEVFE